MATSLGDEKLGTKVYLETYMTLPEILVVPAGYILAQVLILIYFL